MSTEDIGSRKKKEPVMQTRVNQGLFGLNNSALQFKLRWTAD